MYQWVNPTTGHSQMSGKAPAWYRSEVGGPRVLVFEKNVLVDDTAVAVGEDQRLQLRNKALRLEPSEQEKKLIAAEAVATLEAQIQAIVESPAMEEYLKSPPTPETRESAQGSAGQKLIEENRKTGAPSITEDQEEKTADRNQSTRESADERVERLKALISAWDKSNTEEAKSLLDPKDVAEKEPTTSTNRK